MFIFTLYSCICYFVALRFLLKASKITFWAEFIVVVQDSIVDVAVVVSVVDIVVAVVDVIFRGVSHRI